MPELKSSGQDVNLPRDLPMPRYQYQAATVESYSYTYAEDAKHRYLGPDGARPPTMLLRHATLKI